jgi:small-conductance mechanosensitive channel
MATIQEKLDALRQELQEVVEQHNQAVQVQTAAREKAIAIQGAIEALKELEGGEEEAPAEAG